MTYTVATLEVPAAMYAFVLGQLNEAGYQHAIDAENGLIDMTHIAIRAAAVEPVQSIALNPAILAAQAQLVQHLLACMTKYNGMDMRTVGNHFGLALKFVADMRMVEKAHTVDNPKVSLDGGDMVPLAERPDLWPAWVRKVYHDAIAGNQLNVAPATLEN